MANAGGERRGQAEVGSGAPTPGNDGTTAVVTEAAAEPAVAPVRRVRMTPTARRAELVATARQVLADGGLNEAGMAEVARAARVSKGLIYHYFPAGRPDLLDAVGHELATELTERVARAAAAPFSPSVRVEQVLAAIFAYFDEHPVAYRVLFVESCSQDVDGSGSFARARLSGELVALLAAGGADADELLACSTGLVGFVLANVELCLAGMIGAEDAWRASCRCASTLVAPTG